MIRRTTWIILIVFAVLLAATLFWQNSKLSESEEAIPTTSVQFMLDLDEGTIEGLEIVDANGKAVALDRNDDGAWNLTRPAGEETNTTAVDTAITQLLSARVLLTPSSVKSLADLGLDSPSYVFVLHLDDGSQYLINVGNPTPTGNGYYVLTSDRIIYVVSRSNLDSIIAFLDNPPVQPTPTLEPTPEGTSASEDTPATTEGTPSGLETEAMEPTPTP